MTAVCEKCTKAAGETVYRTFCPCPATGCELCGLENASPDDHDRDSLIRIIRRERAARVEAEKERDRLREALRLLLHTIVLRAEDAPITGPAINAARAALSGDGDGKQGGGEG